MSGSDKGDETTAPDGSGSAENDSTASLAITKSAGGKRRMFSKLRARMRGESGGSDNASAVTLTPGDDADGEAAPTQRRRMFSRLKSRLQRTREGFSRGLRKVVKGRRSIDEDLLEELETQLLLADVGVDATTEIVRELTAGVKRRQLTDGDALLAALRDHLRRILEPCSQPLQVPAQQTPFVILVVGVNGAGKTTTIGKLARRLQDRGKSVMLAAGDTFRAAAVEQLQVWGERNGIPVVAQHSGADSASVVYDALESARARNVDVLIADTAGRLHTKGNLMEELKKIRRVLGKIDPLAPHEVMLVVDGGTGQNALNQALSFHEAVGLTGIVLSKLDGTAKGGIIFAIASKLGIPIRYIGIGEGISDLRDFDAGEFVEALFD
jgi:fused signal recognition particle receptor